MNRERKMRRKMKWLPVLAVLLGCLLLTGWAGAEVRPIIRDDADLLTAAEEEQLYLEMLPICEYGTPMFYTTTEAGDYERISEDFLHRQVGMGGSGIVFTINMRARQLIISADGAIYRVVNRSEANTITDNVYKIAGRGEYYDCASSAFEQIDQLLRGEQIARPMKIVSNVLLALVGALMVVYLYISNRYENKPKTGKAGAALPVTAVGAAALFSAVNYNAQTRMTKQTRTSLSSSSGGGRFGGGGGGGGGSSGGSGSHGF